MKNFLFGLIFIFCSTAHASFWTALGSITQAQLAARTTGTSVAAGGVAINLVASTSSCVAVITPTQLGSNVTIVTTGRPVFVGLQPNSTTVSNVSANSSGGLFPSSIFYIYRDGTPISNYNIFSNAAVNSSISVSVTMIWFIDVGATAGSHTYGLWAAGSASGQNACAQQTNIVAYEL